MTRDDDAMEREIRLDRDFEREPLGRDPRRFDHVAPPPPPRTLDPQWAHGRATEYLQGELTQAEEHAFLEHMTGCADCKAAMQDDLQLRDREDEIRAQPAPASEVEVGQLLTADEERALAACIARDADPGPVFAWAREYKASAAVFEPAMQGRVRITVVDGEQRFDLSDKDAAAVEDLLSRGGGLVLSLGDR